MSSTAVHGSTFSPTSLNRLRNCRMSVKNLFGLNTNNLAYPGGLIPSLSLRTSCYDVNSFSSVFLKVSFIPIKCSPVKRFEKRQWRQVKLFSKMLPIITAASGDVIRREKSFQTLFWLPRLLLTFSDQFSKKKFLVWNETRLGRKKIGR